jgi:hypothetical protein
MSDDFFDIVGTEAQLPSPSRLEWIRWLDSRGPGLVPPAARSRPRPLPICRRALSWAGGDGTRGRAGSYQYRRDTLLHGSGARAKSAPGIDFSCKANVFRSPKIQHSVQRRDSNGHLGRLPPFGP